MLDLLSSLAKTPLPTLLCIAGVLFLLLSVSGGLSGKIQIPAAKQKTTAFIGAALLIVGLVIYLAPRKESPMFTGDNPPIKEGKIDSQPEEPAPFEDKTPKTQTPAVNPPKTQTEKTGSRIGEYAQMKGYTWQEYGIAFSIPSNFIVKSNTINEFSAVGDVCAVSIKPWHDPSITDPLNVALAAYQITGGTDKKIIEEVPLENLNGLKGHVAYVTAILNGRIVHMYIAGFINLSNSTNFTAQLLWYESTKEGDGTNARTAISILQSFKSIARNNGSGSGGKEMTWGSYGINFKIPNNFKEIQSDNTQYTGYAGAVAISIKPFKDAGVSDPIKVAQMALDISPGTNKKVISEKDLKNLNGLNGYVAYATVTLDGAHSHLVIAGFLNPSNETNFIVQLIFADGSDAENKKNMNLCFDVLSSFKPGVGK